MGPCILKTQNPRAETLPSKAHKYLDHYEKPLNRVSLDSTATNPEELPKKQPDDASRKRQDFATAPSEAKPSELPESFITMFQLLASQNEGGSNPMQEVNYQSSIIRVPQQKKRISQGEESVGKSKLRSIVMSEMEKQQNLDCNKSEMDDYSRLLIRLQKMDFEFILPKLRAGPLIVPLINYNNYEV